MKTTSRKTAAVASAERAIEKLDEAEKAIDAARRELCQIVGLSPALSRVVGCQAQILRSKIELKARLAAQRNVLDLAPGAEELAANVRQLPLPGRRMP